MKSSFGLTSDVIEGRSVSCFGRIIFLSVSKPFFKFKLPNLLVNKLRTHFKHIPAAFFTARSRANGSPWVIIADLKLFCVFSYSPVRREVLRRTSRLRAAATRMSTAAGWISVRIVDSRHFRAKLTVLPGAMLSDSVWAAISLVSRSDSSRSRLASCKDSTNNG